MIMYEYELEALPELEEEYQYEGEWEGELEGEFESEEFFRRLADAARRQVTTLQTPGTWQRDLALRAARAAVDRGLPALGGWAGGVLGREAGGALGGLVGPEGVPIGQAAGGALGRAGGSALGQAAAARLRGYIPAREFESEWEWELEGELNPIRRVYPDVLMEHLGHAAATAQSEAEAEAFLGALIPLAARIIPRVAPAIMRAAPGLIRGVAGVSRTLRRSPSTRPLVRTIPTIVRRTASDIAQQVARGQSVRPQTAVRTLARQTARVLGNPQQCVQAWQRSCALDQRYHRAAGAVQPGPVASR